MQSLSRLLLDCLGCWSPSLPFLFWDLNLWLAHYNPNGNRWAKKVTLKNAFSAKGAKYKSEYSVYVYSPSTVPALTGNRWLQLVQQQCLLGMLLYDLTTSDTLVSGGHSASRICAYQKILNYLSLARLMLMMGVLFCCGAGFFIRRRMYPLPLSVEPAFNVSFTRQPVSTPGQ